MANTQKLIVDNIQLISKKHILETILMFMVEHTKHTIKEIILNNILVTMQDNIPDIMLRTILQIITNNTHYNIQEYMELTMKDSSLEHIRLNMMQYT